MQSSQLLGQMLMSVMLRALFVQTRQREENKLDSLRGWMLSKLEEARVVESSWI